MTGPAKILAIDDEPDLEALIRQRCRRRVRTKDLEFRFARRQEAEPTRADAAMSQLVLAMCLLGPIGEFWV